jgi:hypothetical protein
MKVVKVSEAGSAVLDWLVANPGKVSRYMGVVERIHHQGCYQQTR